MTPNCLSSPRASELACSTTIWPLRVRTIAMIVTRTGRPVGGMPPKSPVWVASTVKRAATWSVVDAEDVVDGDVQVGEGGGEPGEVLPVAVDPGDRLLGGVDADVVGCDETLDGAGVALVPDLFDVVAEDCDGHVVISCGCSPPWAGDES